MKTNTTTTVATVGTVFVLVFSVMAPFVPTSTVASPSVGQSDTTALSGSSTVEPGTINETLQSATGTVEVVVQVAQLEKERTATAHNASATLREHAQRTQRPVLSFAKSHAGAISVEQQLWLSNVLLLEVDTAEISLEKLAAVSGVERLSPNKQYHVPKPVEKSNGDRAQSTTENTTYGLDQVNATTVWEEYDTRGAGVKVAVLDSGLAIDHPDLELYTDNASDPTYPGGWAEFTTEGEQVSGSEPHAVCGDHGTHTSGTVAGGDASGEWIGVAPEVELMHGAVLTEQSLLGCGGSTVEVIAGMQWAVSNDADVISMSLGGPADGSMVAAVRNADAAGTLVVGAMGNAGAGTIGSPGAVYESVGVGATNESLGIAEYSGGAEIDTDATFPNPPAEWPDTYVTPDISAPGHLVKSSVPGGGYAAFSGTSMATPHVAGVAALLQSIGGEDVGPDQIKRALYESAFKPATCSPSCSPRDGNDTRYGAGIVDAYGATEYLQLVPEHELGDVDESGTITVQDVRVLQRHLAGTLDSETTFDENLADIDRDGSITYADLRILQLKVRGDITPGQLQLSNLTAPSSVEHGSVATVTVDVTNPGDEGVYTELSYQFGPNESAQPYDTTAVELQPGASTTVSFSVDTAAFTPGSYNHAVVSADDTANATLRIAGSQFVVSDLQAPSTVEQDETYSVSATVTNAGNEPGTETVRYSRAGTTVATQNVTLDPGATTTVTFADQSVTALSGDIEHGLVTPADSVHTPLSVLAAEFSISDPQVPSNVSVGETYRVNATITNTGTAGGTQTVEYRLSESAPSVAVVDSGTGYGSQVVEALATALPEGYSVSLVADENAMNVTDDHDVFVMQDVDPTDLDVSAFVSETNTPAVGVVWLDNWGSDSNAIAERSVAVGDPATTDEADAGSTPVNYTITSSHPIVDGIGSPGEHVPIHTAEFADRSWYDGYDGETIATVSAGGDDAGGPALGVDPETATVLASTLGREYFVQNPDFTPAADQLLANAVTWADSGSVGTARQGRSDDSTETVTLEPGESTRVSLSNTVDPTAPVSDDYQHVLSTDDETVSIPVSVRPETGSLAGTITAAGSGEPVANASVTVRGENLSANYTTTTAGDGTYSIAGLPVGTHTLHVDTDQYEHATTTVTIESGVTTTADLALSARNGTISGTVTASDTGEPIDATTIQLEDDSGTVYTATTNDTGVYTIDVPPGYYVVNVADAPSEYTTEQVVSVAPGESLTGVDFQLTPKTGTIEGYVTNAAGVPVADAQVVDADQGAFSATTDENGYYSIAGLDRGAYALRVSAPGYNTTDISFVEVAANETVEQNFTVGSYLTVSNLTAPANASHGETITVSATITNVGTETATRSVVYFPPGTPFGDDRFTGASDGVQTVTLAGNESTTVSFEYTVEESLEAGSYRHGISADEVASSTITIGGSGANPADALQVTNVSAPATTTPGAPIGVNATVTNTATTTVTGPVTYSFDGSTVATSNVTIAPGATTSVLFEHTVPNASGTYDHSVETAANAITEPITVEAAGSDPAYFAVSNLTGPDTTAPGETVTVNATVRNTGDETATQSVFFFFMETQAKTSINTTAAGTATMTKLYQPLAARQVTLAGGEQRRLSFAYTVASDTSPGAYEYAVSSLQETAVGQIDIETPNAHQARLTAAQTTHLVAG